MPGVPTGSKQPGRPDIKATKKKGGPRDYFLKGRISQEDKGIQGENAGRAERKEASLHLVRPPLPFQKGWVPSFGAQGGCEEEWV